MENVASIQLFLEKFFGKILMLLSQIAQSVHILASDNYTCDICYICVIYVTNCLSWKCAKTFR